MASPVGDHEPGDALVGMVSAGLVLRGRRLLIAPHIYAAAAGFLAVASFFLWRNAIVYRNPFHNFNDHALWVDGWNEVWRLLRDPEWERVGLGWYLRHHSVWALAWRVVKGGSTSSSHFESSLAFCERPPQ